MLLDERYQHPNGQVPAYEWNFSDVNPPVHAWATLHVYDLEKRQATEQGDIAFLQEVFHKLSLELHLVGQPQGSRRQRRLRGRLPGPRQHRRVRPQRTAAHRRPARAVRRHGLDGVLSPDHADHRPRTVAPRPVLRGRWPQVLRALPVDRRRHGRSATDANELWDDEDGFFYDVLRAPDGSATRLKVRSLVGLLPLAACVVIEPDNVARLPWLMERARCLSEHRPDLVASIPSPASPGSGRPAPPRRRRRDKLRRILGRMLDEEEFLGAHGIRSLSRHHLEHPFVVARRRQGVPRRLPSRPSR